MLLPQLGAQAFGMVFALTNREIDTLYAEPGLDMYRPELVTASLEDGRFATVTTFNLGEGFASEQTNSQYAAKLRAVLERLGFPTDYVRSVG